MSILSKIFVLLVTILSVLLAALIIPFVSNVEDYRGQRDSANNKAAIAQLATAVAQSELRQLQQLEAIQIRDLRAQNQQLQSNIDRLKNELATAQQELVKSDSDLVKTRADVSRFAASSDQNAQLLTRVTADLKQTREGLVDAQTKNIQLGDANTELESTVQVLNRQVRTQKETIQEFEERTLTLQEKLAQVPAEFFTKKTEVAPELLRRETSEAVSGLVTDVVDRDGVTLVQINLGKVDGISENILFRVHRGNEFLGRLVVKAVDDRSAAGPIELQKQGIQIKPGDRVQSGGVNQ